MTAHKFIQIHTLTSFSGVLLNRDDSGMAKRIPYGGVSRTRVSSQCLKRHWRTHKGIHSLSNIDIPKSVRSRYTFDEKIAKPLIADGLDKRTVREATKSLMLYLLGDKAKAKGNARENDEASDEASEEEAPSEATILKTDQITVFGEKELAYLRDQVRVVCSFMKGRKKASSVIKEVIGKEGLANLKALQCGAGLDAAMFGRMVTSDNMARVDSAIHVAHAFTVHAETTEADYFSAIDDLQKDVDNSLGSGHINTTELTSGLFYCYVAIDVPLLVSNITGCKAEDFENADRELPSKVIESLMHLIAKVSPGAKLGSTAPYAWSEIVVVEKGNEQPRRLDKAFCEPVSTNGNVIKNACDALAKCYLDMVEMYGNGDQVSKHAAMINLPSLEEAFGKKLSFDELVTFASNPNL